MSKYPTPKLFKPTLEKQKEVAYKIATQLSNDKGVILSDGTVVPGTRNKLKVS